MAREAHLNDRADIDTTGKADMAPTITRYLAEYAASGVNAVYLGDDSTYRLDSTVVVPTPMTLEGNPAQSYGPSYPGARFLAGADDITMIQIETGARLQGVCLGLQNRANVVGIKPNYINNRITFVTFYDIAASSVGVRGGGLMGFTFTDNSFYNVAGRGVDILSSYAASAGAYYGVNVGRFERNQFGAKAGGLRVEGICTVNDNWFEAYFTGPAMEVTGKHNSYMQISNNYWEQLGGTGQALSVGAGNFVITRNTMYGVPSRPVGSYGIEFRSTIYSLDMRGNYAHRHAHSVISQGVANNGQASVAGNYFNDPCTGPLFTPAVALQTGAVPSPAYVQIPSVGHLFRGGSLMTQIVQYADAHGATIDLRKGAYFLMSHTNPAAMGFAHPQPGMQLIVEFRGGVVTLPNAVWHNLSGVDDTPAAGEVRQYVVRSTGAMQQVG